MLTIIGNFPGAATDIPLMRLFLQKSGVFIGALEYVIALQLIRVSKLPRLHP